MGEQVPDLAGTDYVPMRIDWLSIFPVSALLPAADQATIADYPFLQARWMYWATLIASTLLLPAGQQY